MGTEPERLDVGHDEPPPWWERRRSRSVGTVVVTSTALAVVGLGAAELLVDAEGSTPPRAATTSSLPTPPSNVMAMRVQTMNGFRVVGFGSVSLIVPSYWGRDEVTDCGVPSADTVPYPSGRESTRSCDDVLGSRHSFVAFDTTPCSHPGRLHRDADLTRRLGQPALSSGTRHRHDVYEVQVGLGSSPGCIVMSSAYRPVVARLLGTLRPAADGPP